PRLEFLAGHGPAQETWSRTVRRLHASDIGRPAARLAPSEGATDRIRCPRVAKATYFSTRGRRRSAERATATPGRRRAHRAPAVFAVDVRTDRAPVCWQQRLDGRRARPARDRSSPQSPA